MVLRIKLINLFSLLELNKKGVEIKLQKTFRSCPRKIFLSGPVRGKFSVSGKQP